MVQGMSELGFQNLKTSSAFASSPLYSISPHLEHWQGQHYCWSKCDQVRDLGRIYGRHDEAVVFEPSERGGHCSGAARTRSVNIPTHLSYPTTKATCATDYGYLVM